MCRRRQEEVDHSAAIEAGAIAGGSAMLVTSNPPIADTCSVFLAPLQQQAATWEQPAVTAVAGGGSWGAWGPVGGCANPRVEVSCDQGNPKC